jgi:hypothetical protein
MPYDCVGMTFHDLVVHFGTVQKAAAALNCSRPTVYDWRDKGIPDDRQLEIQERTRGCLKADRSIVNRYRRMLRWAA